MADLHGHGQRQLLLAPGQHVRDQALQRGGQARHDGDGQGHPGRDGQHSQVMVIGYTVRIILVRTFIPLKTEKVTKPMFVFYVNFHIALFNDKSI